MNAIRETLQDECIKAEIIEQFINRSKEITYVKIKNRLMVASMNKACETLYYYIDMLNNDFINQRAVSIRASSHCNIFIAFLAKW